MIRSLLILILGWYLFSITLALYNKWMFDPSKGLQISCPITVTAFHQFVLWGLSYGFVRYRRSKSRGDPSYNEPRNDWKFCLRLMVPTAIASSGDIGFGNVSFKFVPLTIYTIIKSASVAFVLLFGCLFKLEKFHWKLTLIVIVMFLGVTMMVLSPSNKNEQVEDRSTLVFGSLLVVMSSCLSGLRWVFTQLILRTADSQQQNEHGDDHGNEHETEHEYEQRGEQISQSKGTLYEKPHPIYTIYQLAPIMGVVLLFTGLIIERPFPAVLKSQLFTVTGDPTQRTVASIVKGIVLLIIPGFEVFFMTICEFGILQVAHVLTLSIAGILKELLTILLSTLFLGERLSGPHNWIGMSVILLDVAYYNYFRYQQGQDSLTALEKLDILSNSDRADANHNRSKDESKQELIPPPFSQDYELDTMAVKTIRPALQ